MGPTFDGLVKSPAVYLKAVLHGLHVGGSGTRPIMGVRPDAPTIGTIFLVNFCEMVGIK